MVQSVESIESPSRFQAVAEPVPTGYEREWMSYRAPWWGAIIAGAFAAISLQIVFGILGTAIGLTVVAAPSDASETGLSIGAGIYWLITGLLSLFAGGWLAGWLRHTIDGSVGMIHGFLTWCAVAVFSTLLIVMAGGAAIGGSLAAFGDTMATDFTTRTEAESKVDRATSVSADEAAKNAAGASWWTLVALVLGASVAAAGGATAVGRAERYARAPLPARRVP